jgi:hypothetical protein
MARGRLRGTVLGKGRWVRPPIASVIILFGALLGVIATEIAFFRWATSSYDEARTIAAAGSLLRRPIRLESALAVEWREAMTESGGPGSWDRLLAPPVPPAICTPDSMSIGAEAAARLDDAVRALDNAIRRDALPADIERRLVTLREVNDLPRGGIEEFIVRYNLGRGHLAAGDYSAAAEVIEPIFTAFLDTVRLPVTNAALLSRHVRNNGIEQRAALGYHARFLAGAIAYRRGEMAHAIRHFRLAINTINYIAHSDSSSFDTPEHYQRVSVQLPHSCAGSDDVLSSLDAYAALVAAYMAAPEFTDPPRLPPEVKRTRLQIDPDDPFRPILRFARAVADRPSRSAIPENLLWAASNLQRVYHHNRLDPDARLAVTRTVLLLHLTSNSGWVEALSASGETDVCAMLTSVATQLERDASARTLATRPRLATDSAQAAVAIYTFARVERDCGRDHAPPLSPAVRSAWLLHGRGFMGGGLPGLYEEWRNALEDALRPASASETAVASAIAGVLDGAEAHRGAFDSGRVPADLPASIRAQDGRRFVNAWKRAVFVDVADALADAGAAANSPEMRTVAVSSAGASAGRELGIPAGRAHHFLASLNSAIAHAGIRPAQVYAPTELARLASSGGGGALAEYRLRYFIRSYPAAAVAALAVMFVLLAIVLIAIHVGVWRYRLLMRDRLYGRESSHRFARTGEAA